MRAKTRLVAAFLANAFDAPAAALDAKMSEHAACQCEGSLWLRLEGRNAGLF
jgi:hypothetical protein